MTDEELLHMTYAFCAGLGRNAAFMLNEDMPVREFDALYEAVGQRLYPTAGLLSPRQQALIIGIAYENEIIPEWGDPPTAYEILEQALAAHRMGCHTHASDMIVKISEERQ